MHRWWGSKADSEKQSGERDARAARRTISELPTNFYSSDEDGEYADCNTSGFFGNVDGADDLDEADIMAAELARQKALPVEDANSPMTMNPGKKKLN